MSNRRRLIAIIGAIGVVAGLVVVTGAAMAARTANPRDEVAFVAYEDRNFPGWSSSGSRGVPARDRDWADQHPEAVLAEGDAACAWLDSQPDVPDLVPSGSATVETTALRYLEKTSDSTGVDIDEQSRARIVIGAWAYLCPGTRDAHTSPVSTYVE